jgi:hypothetical protein
MNSGGTHLNMQRKEHIPKQVINRNTQLRIVVGVNGLRASKALAVIVLVDALIMAFGHAPLALFLGPVVRSPPVRRPANVTSTRSQGAAGGPAFPFFAIGAYFLIATILYILGGILVVSGKLFRLTKLGLIVLAVVDNVLLIYTRAMPNIFFRRPIPWSWEWWPVGTVQILIGQTIIIVLCAILLYKPKLQETQPPFASKDK